MFPDPEGIEPAASRSRVGRESDCATESGSYLKRMIKQNDTFTITEYKQKLTASEEPHWNGHRKITGRWNILLLHNHINSADAAQNKSMCSALVGLLNLMSETFQ